MAKICQVCPLFELSPKWQNKLVSIMRPYTLKLLSISTKHNQPIYYEDTPVSCRLCLMMCVHTFTFDDHDDDDNDDEHYPIKTHKNPYMG